MPTPTLANVPQNQIDALPILQSGAGGGSAVLVGGSVVRKWTAAQTGINTIATQTDANGHVFCVTGFLDTTGCRSFTALMLRASAAGALAAVTPMTVWFQMRVDAADVAPTSLGAVINLPFCGMSQVNTATITWPAMAGAAEVDRALRCWDLSEIMGVAGTAGSQGADVRLFMSFGSVAVDADNRFSMILWGSS